MPTSRDIKAKNAQFALSARENAGKPRIRTPKKSTSEAEEEESFETRQANKRRGRQIVKPAKKTQTSGVSGLKNNKLALGLVLFVVVGGVFFELIRLFL